MPRQLISRLLLVCAILLAQQTALAHDFWHATASSASGEPGKNSKCDLHDLLGTVLGAVNAPLLSQEFLSLAEAGFAAAPALAAGDRPLSRHSRDPPLTS